MNEDKSKRTYKATVSRTKGTGSMWMDPAEVAEVTFSSMRTVYRMLDNGTIPGRKVGRRWFVYRPALMEMLAGTARR